MIQREPKVPITLQFRSKTPLSEQVRRAIFASIQDGTLKEGSTLPTVRELAGQLGVNFNTVARAYRMLDKEGWLLTRQGRGTVVTRPDREAATMEKDRAAIKIQDLIITIKAAAHELDLDPLALVREIEKRIQNAPVFAEIVKHKIRRKREKNHFRSFHANIPKSRKASKRLPAWRMRAKR